jgi:Protein phosphatase inhibitor.
MSRTRQPMGPNSFQTTAVSSQDSTAHIPTLRLRAEAPTDTSEATSSSRRIRWSEDVVDNEGMGKKSSKGMDLFYLFDLPPIHPRKQQRLTATSMLHLSQSPASGRK